MFSWLKKLIKKIIDFIKKYWWVILLVVVAVWAFPAFGAKLGALWAKAWPAIKAGAAAISSGISKLWSGAVGLGKELGPAKTLALGMGLVSAISPSTASKIVSNVGEAVEDAAGTAVSVAGSVISTVARNPAFLIGGGILLFMLLRR